MTKTIYNAGRYEIQWRGRGPIFIDLTKSQAKAMFEIHRKLSHEFTGLLFVDNS